MFMCTTVRDHCVCCWKETWSLVSLQVAGEVWLEPATELTQIARTMVRFGRNVECDIHSLLLLGVLPILQCTVEEGLQDCKNELT
jgi:hypothetical protein